MIYKRGGVYWYKIKFEGVEIRESTGLTNKETARDAQDKRRLGLREGRAGIVRPGRIPLFSVAADAWLTARTDEWAPKTAIIEKTNLSHLESTFGNCLLNDISPADVGAYRAKRLRDKAAQKTISLELGTLRAVMLFYDLDAKWRAIRKKVKLQKARKLGRVITTTEETALLAECRRSRSRSLPVAVALALQTCTRYSEIRLLQWRQLDFGRRVITVGQSKTDAGTGREIPMTSAAKQTLQFWAANFPNRKPNHFVFPQSPMAGRVPMKRLDSRVARCTARIQANRSAVGKKLGNPRRNVQEWSAGFTISGTPDARGSSRLESLILSLWSLWAGPPQLRFA